MSDPTGFFVTGTDTEVGKTLVAGALIELLKKKYARVAAFKPVVAGLALYDGVLANEDVLALSQVANAGQTSEEICPYALKMPAAPHLVAEIENIQINIDSIRKSFAHCQKNADAVVVEGAGGFYVPLQGLYSFADFAKEINLPVVMVVAMRLGCINHALLTAKAIAAEGLKLKGWVANTMGHAMPLLDENIKTLQERLPGQYLGKLPSFSESEARTPYSLETIKKAASHLRLPHG